MEAVVCTDFGESAVQEIPRPDPGPEEVLVAVDRVQLTVTECRLYRGDHIAHHETVARDEVGVEEWGGRDGAPYRITRTNFKPYACGYFMQAPITAVLDLVEAPDITRRRAENPGLIPARARVTTAAGSYETEIDYPNGHWKQPMTDDQLEGKFDALAEGLLTEEQAAGVKEWSYSLDSVEDVSSVFSELRV